MACVAFVYVRGSWAIWHGYSTDFDQLWQAARELLAGRSPYNAIRGFNTEHNVAWGLLYPLPAVLVALPVSWMPLESARAIVAASGAFCFCWLLTRDGYARLPILLSAAFRSSISLVQLTPFVACAAMSPWFGWALACKPNVALGVLAAARSRTTLVRLIVAAAATTAVSLLAWPTWPMEWIEAVRGPNYLRPLIARPGGFLLLLVGLRWRRPEARWMLMTILIPSTANTYEALPLLAIMSLSFRESLIVGILSHIADISAYALRADQTYASLAQANALTILWFLYVPIAVLILRRPNEPSVPDSPQMIHGPSALPTGSER